MAEQYYHATQRHIADLQSVIRMKKMIAPDAFFKASVQKLQRCYNGIGPERWSARFRNSVTMLLDQLEAPALIHDWEWSYMPKTFRNFVMSNIRLTVNAWKDKRFRSGFLAGVLCLLFGWGGFRGGVK